MAWAEDSGGLPFEIYLAAGGENRKGLRHVILGLNVTHLCRLTTAAHPIS